MEAFLQTLPVIIYVLLIILIIVLIVFILKYDNWYGEVTQIMSALFMYFFSWNLYRREFNLAINEYLSKGILYSLICFNLHVFVCGAFLNSFLVTIVMSWLSFKPSAIKWGLCFIHPHGMCIKYKMFFFFSINSYLVRNIYMWLYKANTSAIREQALPSP